MRYPLHLAILSLGVLSAATPYAERQSVTQISGTRHRSSTALASVDTASSTCETSSSDSRSDSDSQWESESEWEWEWGTEEQPKSKCQDSSTSILAKKMSRDDGGSNPIEKLFEAIKPYKPESPDSSSLPRHPEPRGSFNTVASVPTAAPRFNHRSIPHSKSKSKPKSHHYHHSHAYPKTLNNTAQVTYSKVFNSTAQATVASPTS